ALHRRQYEIPRCSSGPILTSQPREQPLRAQPIAVLHNARGRMAVPQVSRSTFRGRHFFTTAWKTAVSFGEEVGSPKVARGGRGNLCPGPPIMLMEGKGGTINQIIKSNRAAVRSI